MHTIVRVPILPSARHAAENPRITAARDEIASLPGCRMQSREMQPHPSKLHLEDGRLMYGEIRRTKVGNSFVRAALNFPHFVVQFFHVIVACVLEPYRLG